MKAFNEKTENKLNDLLEKAYDSEKGFVQVSKHVDNPKLKTFFIEKARERSGYINELSNTLKVQGMTVSDKDGSTSGALHRTWVDTKVFLSMEDDESILEEVRHGEKVALKDYNDVLDNCELHPSVRETLIKQKNAIQANCNKIDYLENIH